MAARAGAVRTDLAGGDAAGAALPGTPDLKETPPGAGRSGRAGRGLPSSAAVGCGYPRLPSGLKLNWLSCQGPVP